MKIRESEIKDASILIVDDQAGDITLLESLLLEAGYSHIQPVMDSRRVRDLHAANHYDLILLDLHMPGMDGFEVIEALKTGNADGYLPVLVITREPGHELRALQAGARDFVSKPFDGLQIKTRIHNLLEIGLLYKRLGRYNAQLEATVLERTAELRASEARFRGLTELASDWYWEQDKDGAFVNVSGPVREMLGISDESEPKARGWNEAARQRLQATIAARQPFLDFVFNRVNADGSSQRYQVSGEPMFDASGRFSGYRGVGVELAGQS
jgi:PAS domain S-box-containing protein